MEDWPRCIGAADTAEDRAQADFTTDQGVSELRTAC